MMRKSVIPLLLLLMIIGLGFYLSSNMKDAPAPSDYSSPTSKPKQVERVPLTAIPDKPAAPDFELRDDEGKIHTLSDYKGKTVIVNFWATWCPPCRAELPSMNRAWAKLKDHNVEMLAVNVGEDEDTIFAFTGEYPIDFQILMDESGEIISRWPIKGLPTTFVVDKEGRLVYRAIGGREWDSDEIINAIKAVK